MQLKNPGPLARSRFFGYASSDISLKSRWQSHESDEKPEPMAPDRSIQAVSLLNQFFKSPLPLPKYVCSAYLPVHLFPDAICLNAEVAFWVASPKENSF